MDESLFRDIKDLLNSPPFDKHTPRICLIARTFDEKSPKYPGESGRIGNVVLFRVNLPDLVALKDTTGLWGIEIDRSVGTMD